MADLDIDSLEPTFFGPTWQVTEDNEWHLPELTLGWQVAGWCSEFLAAEDGGPWTFTSEQLRFLLWWYAVDETGRFIYRKGVLQRMKGWGKDPLLAVMCLVELVGPSRFIGWDEEGNPVGAPHPQAWVQVTAVNQAQTTNTMALIPSLMTDLFIATYNIEPGAVLIRANGGRQRLEAVTSSYRALEGKRTTFTLLNETHHWVSGNNGHKMYETIDGNATKKDSRYLAITNAYLPGEDSVAERMREAWERMVEGKARQIGFLYDSIEAHPKTPLTPEALRIVIPKIRGDAAWLNIEAIIESVLDTTIPTARSRRMWLNQIVADEDALYQSSDWDDLCDEGLVLSAGDEIVLGFDGGKTDDDTALVAIRVRDRAAFVLGHWHETDIDRLREAADRREGSDQRWEVDKERVNDAVLLALSTYKVRAFFADVHLWESYIDAWATKADDLSVKAGQGHKVAWDMRSSLQRSTRAHERLMSSILDGQLRHDGDRALRRHVLNARRRENNFGLSFGKESRESRKKVDLYAALMIAHEALHELTTKGKATKERTGRAIFL
jgi:phage terminase large subunit-like protein